MYDFGPEANCNGLDTELFFTDATKTYPQMPLLKRVCGNCVVQEACLDYALHHAVLGWWGGTSELQRKRLRKKLNIIAEPLFLSYK